MRAVIFTLPLALAACAVSLGAVVGPTEAQQIAVLESCKSGFGVGGVSEYQVDYGRTDTGALAVNVAITPYDIVTAAAADRINDCAASQLALVPIATPVAPDRVPAAAGCPPGFTGMYRGTLYCTGA